MSVSKSVLKNPISVDGCVETADADRGSSSNSANSPKKSPDSKDANVVPESGALISTAPFIITYIPSAGASFLNTCSSNL